MDASETRNHACGFTARKCRFSRNSRHSRNNYAFSPDASLLRLVVVLLFAILSLTDVSTVRAQGTEEEVRQVVQQALDGLASRDTTSLSAVFDSSATLLIVSKESPNTPLVLIPIHDIIAGLTNPGPERREQIRNERVFVSSDLATLVADYVFYLDDVLHHCGVAMYDLARVQDRWRLVQIRQTDRREDCPP